MKHTKIAKKIMGGLRDVTDDDFKYTLDKGRIEFIKAIYPHLGTIINNINAIEWNTYNYTGPDILTKVFTNLNNETEEKVVFIKTEPIYINQTDPIDIIYLGGIVYELLNKEYDNVNLLRYTDPTSDIDININKIPNQDIVVYTDGDIPIQINSGLETCPGTVKAINNKNELVDVTYTELAVMSNEIADETKERFNEQFTLIRNFYDLERKLTPYYRHLTTWMFDEFVKCFDTENLKGLTTSSSFYDLQEKDLKDYHELSGLVDDVEQGYLTKKIGNCFLIGFLTRIGTDPQDDISSMDSNARMYKIQLIAKTNGENSKYDHMMEMIILFKYESVGGDVGKALTQREKLFIQKYKDNDHIYHQNMIKLMVDNTKALKDRQIFIEDLSERYVHKAFNHIKRMLYLIELINKNKNSFLKTDKYGITVASGNAIFDFYTYIQTMIKNKKKFPIKAYLAPDGTISSFEFIDPKNILLAYIMLFLYGCGFNNEYTNLQYYINTYKPVGGNLSEEEKRRTALAIISANIPDDFKDIENGELKKGSNGEGASKVIVNILLESNYTENNKYNELMSTIKKVFVGGVGGRKTKRRKTKKRKTKKRKTQKNRT